MGSLDSLRWLRTFDSPGFGRRAWASLPVGRRVEWSLARSRKNGPSTRSLRSLAQDIRLAWIWPKAMSEPAGRQASRMVTSEVAEEWSFDSVAALPRSGHSTRVDLAEGHERACR